AGIEDHRANPAPRPFWMNEERSNLSGVVKRVEQFVLSLCPMVAAIHSFALAPAATADDKGLSA
ncbi:MAG TPA: hypothetical protein VG488_05495, partial [Candidatus Angelobacter sp.]|nr:hypothetical protein [Candidatus Angelobacter sp.]